MRARSWRASHERRNRMERAGNPSLGAVQQRLRQLITEPDGVEAAPAAESTENGAALGELIRADRGLSPVDRLAVYANAYFARLHDGLREDFAALARALG